MKRILSFLLILLLMIPVACGSNDSVTNDPNLGVYRADTMEYNGFSVSVKEYFESGFEIELKSNGKCELRVDGEKANGKWTLSGNAFTVKGGGIDCTGTLENGLMRLNYDEDVIINLISDSYAGESAPAGSITQISPSVTEAVPNDPPAAPAQTEAVPVEPAKEEDPTVGIYKAVSFDSGGYVLPVEVAFDDGILLELKADGSAVLNLGADSESYSWTRDGSAFTLTAPGIEPYSGTLDDGLLTVSIDATILRFYKEDDPRTHLYDAGYFVFVNQAGTTLHNFYISDDPDSWGDSLLESSQFLENEASITVPFSEAGLVSGSKYDFAAIDGDRTNFDVYDITLQSGDILVLLKVSDEACLLTSVHSDGTSERFSGKCYVD